MFGAFVTQGIGVGFGLGEKAEIFGGGVGMMHTATGAFCDSLYFECIVSLNFLRLPI